MASLKYLKTGKTLGLLAQALAEDEFRLQLRIDSVSWRPDVRVCHLPSGLVEHCGASLSRMRNEEIAIGRIKAKLQGEADDHDK